MSTAIAEWGVVGAGGGGYPTDAKLGTPVPLVIANGAECEPLLHKDKELLRHEARAFIEGLRTVMAAVGADRAVVGVKDKYQDVIASLRSELPPEVTLFPLSDSYPAGDELVLVHDVTGRIVPPGGLPRDVGALVLNVETLVNVGHARPVTHKYLTVAGAVRQPVTLRAPLGLSIGEAITAAGGPSEPEIAVLVGGVMMARLARGLDEPITKTTGGLVVLPANHPLVRRHAATPAQVERIGRAACDQCRFCTELCPRYLIGHPIEPHRAMQALGFAGPKSPLLAGTLYCCECNLCTLFACPEDLDPKSVCAAAKPVAREQGLGFRGRIEDLRAHPLAGQRRIPTRRLIARLGLSGFRNLGPLEERPFAPSRVRLPLKQHAGAPALPVVRPGERVRAGDVVAAPAAGALGARIHASIAGTVRDVQGAVLIEA